MKKIYARCTPSSDTSKPGLVLHLKDIKTNGSIAKDARKLWGKDFEIAAEEARPAEPPPADPDLAAVVEELERLGREAKRQFQKYKAAPENSPEATERWNAMAEFHAQRRELILRNADRLLAALRSLAERANRNYDEANDTLNADNAQLRADLAAAQERIAKVEAERDGLKAENERLLGHNCYDAEKRIGELRAEVERLTGALQEIAKDAPHGKPDRELEPQDGDEEWAARMCHWWAATIARAALAAQPAPNANGDAP